MRRNGPDDTQNRTPGEDSIRISNPTVRSSPSPKQTQNKLNLDLINKYDSKKKVKGKLARGTISYGTPGLATAHHVPSVSSIASLVAITGEDLGNIPVPEVSRSVAAGEGDSTLVRASSPAVGVDDVMNTSARVQQAVVSGAGSVRSSVLGITSGEDAERPSNRLCESRSVDSGERSIESGGRSA